MALSLTPIQLGTITSPGRLPGPASSYTRKPENSWLPSFHWTGLTTSLAAAGRAQAAAMNNSATDNPRMSHPGDMAKEGRV